ncbi:hypothetical protein ACM3CZ_00790 [Edwardsiella ictaluri]
MIIVILIVVAMPDRAAALLVPIATPFPVAQRVLWPVIQRRQRFFRPIIQRLKGVF